MSDFHLITDMSENDLLLQIHPDAWSPNWSVH